MVTNIFGYSFIQKNYIRPTLDRNMQGAGAGLDAREQEVGVGPDGNGQGVLVGQGDVIEARGAGLDNLNKTKGTGSDVKNSQLDYSVFRDIQLDHSVHKNTGVKDIRLGKAGRRADKETKEQEQERGCDQPRRLPPGRAQGRRQDQGRDQHQ